MNGTLIGRPRVRSHAIKGSTDPGLTCGFTCIVVMVSRNRCIRCVPLKFEPNSARRGLSIPNGRWHSGSHCARYRRTRDW